MNAQNRRRWRIVRQYIIGWALAFLLYSIFRGEGTQELGSVRFELGQSMLVATIAGMALGLVSGLAQVLLEERRYRRLSIQNLLLLRTAYVISFLISTIILAYLIFGKDISFLEFAFEPGSFSAYLFIVLVDVFMFCLRQVNLFLGSDNLWKLFRGKFYTPHEEERIFMFLDLQSSTTHAERIGHIQYSKLIQDCFNDLGVVAENGAEIYQYVGDEVVLTWKLEDGLANQNCLRAFYNFKAQLEKRAEHYQKQYACMPRFKAGLNSGLVTATEVGKYKKEIAFHGDSINTAARIQGKCNEFGEELLLSGNLREAIDTTAFSFEELGSIELRGKEQKVPLFAARLL